VLPAKPLSLCFPILTAVFFLRCVLAVSAKPSKCKAVKGGTLTLRWRDGNLTAGEESHEHCNELCTTSDAR
jgi:hypothetical protein